MVALTLPYTELLKKKACRVFDLASLLPLCAHICPTMTYPPQHPDFPAFTQGSTIHLHQNHLLKIQITDEYIKRIWYIYTMEYYLAKKKNKMMPFAGTWMDLEIIIPSKVIQTKTIYDITPMGNLKNKTNELIYKTKQIQRQQIYGC